MMRGHCWRRATTSAAAFLALATSPLVASAAEPADLAPLYGTTSTNTIDGSYLVVLDDSVRGITAGAVAGAIRVTPTATYRTVLRGFAARLDAAALAAVRADPAVAFVSTDRTVRLQTTQAPATWGLDRVDQRKTPLSDSFSYRLDGGGVHVYVLDTGIRTTHTEFTGRVDGGVNVVGDEDPAAYEDCNGHGTSTAGTVAGTTWGVAKGALLTPVRVFGCGSTGSTSDLIEGLDWVAANAITPAVATMSISADADEALDLAANGLIDAGIALTVSAGNDTDDACAYSPGRVDRVVTVGATRVGDRVAGYSNYGACVDLYAPGTAITSAWWTSDTASAVRDGTSMSAPHVAGAVARLLANRPDATPDQVNAKLVKLATKDTLTNLGPGSSNRLLYVPRSA